MKIYRGTVIDPHEGAVISWYSSRRSAEIGTREIAREYGIEDPASAISIHWHEIKPTMFGLLSFLNNHFTRDNG